MKTSYIKLAVMTGLLTTQLQVYASSAEYSLANRDCFDNLLPEKKKEEKPVRPYSEICISYREKEIYEAINRLKEKNSDDFKPDKQKDSDRT